jgi:uncharacterized protein YjbI with pentapeptide repeats
MQARLWVADAVFEIEPENRGSSVVGMRSEGGDLALRGLDLSGFDLSRADLRSADFRGTSLRDADLSGTHLEGANFFKAVLDGANLGGAFLTGAQFLNCAQLVVTRNWESAFRDDILGCGASIPE